ncbi:MAG: hypothetical protein ACR2QV_17015 [Gammaproteobacteria bacterium]
MQTVYLHVGNYKTGTTSLQNFFDLNRAQLLRHGVLFPESCYMQDWRPGLSLGHSLFSRELLGQCSGEIEKLDAEIDSYGDRIERVIISSENLFRASETSADAARAALSRFDVKVVCYLPRQDELVNSLFHEFVSSGWERLPIGPDQFLQQGAELLSPLTDFYGNLMHWARAFGRENVIVRVYEEGQLHANDSVADFLQLLQLDGIDDLQDLSEEYTRVSMPSEVVAALLPINRIPLPLGVYRAALFVFCRDFLPKYRNLPKLSFFSPLTRRDILQDFHESNMKVAKEFLGRNDGRLFFTSPPEEDDPWEPVQVRDAQLVEDLWKVFLAAAAKHVQLNDESSAPT